MTRERELPATEREQQIAQAADFLYRVLSPAAWCWSSDVKAAAAEEGITPKFLWLAKVEGGVPVLYMNWGFPKHTVWWLDESAVEWIEDDDAQAHLGKLRQAVPLHPWRAGQNN